MSFMEPEVTRKGSLYSCDCGKCGRTLYAHEWASWNVNEERDAMQASTLTCPDCGGRADAETFRDHGRRWYAGRYQAPGYLDSTEWEFDTNLRRLQRTLRDLYGEECAA